MGEWGTKQFAFRGLLECGTCGAGVCGEDKYKKLSDGTVKRYVYYRCTKKIDRGCPEKYIGERELSIAILDHIETAGEKIDITKELRTKSHQYVAMALTLTEYYKAKVQFTHPLIEYARYVLKRGSEKEKEALAKGIRRRFLFKQGQVKLAEVSETKLDQPLLPVATT